jgi:iron-sulfur cluster repair protein YtfE (RIC family)
VIDTTDTTIPAPGDERLAGTLIRDLVAAYPATLSVLAPLGIDLCCGGGHALGEAATLHGLDREAVLAQITDVIRASSGDRR